MKKQEVKEKLKQAYEEINVPSFDEGLIQKLEDARLNQTVSPVKKKFVFPWKPAALLLGAGVVAAMIFIPWNSSSPISSVPGNVIEVTRAKNVISNEIMIAGLLTDEETEQIYALRKARSNSENYKESVNLIHEYLLSGELLLNKSDLKTEIFYNDNPNYNYDYLMEVSYSDANDHLMYQFYYSESKRYESDEDDFDEISIDFEGVMIIDNQEYQVFGHRENEENEEYEVETNISFNGEKILKVEQETEINENEYTYTYYQNNQPFREVSQEVETENGRREMSISVKEGNKEQEFEFTYLDDNKISCEYSLEEGESETEIELMITEYNDYYLYQSKGREDIIIDK